MGGGGGGGEGKKKEKEKRETLCEEHRTTHTDQHVPGVEGNTYPFDFEQKRLADRDVGPGNTLDGNDSTLLRKKGDKYD